MSAPYSSKLYILTSPDFVAYSRVAAHGKIVTTPASNVPMIFWPDGKWCVEANLYIAKLFDEGLSRDGRGGSLHTYATQISHLLRFCFGIPPQYIGCRKRKNTIENKINFQDLTDNDFSNFISVLLNDQKIGSSEKKRTPNSVISIGRRCIEFLDFVGKYHQIHNFVGITGQILAEQKATRIFPAGSTSIGYRSYWCHRALPVPGAHKRRLPISTNDIKLLNEAVYEASSSTYLKKRRYLMLTLLEITGARRAEIAALKVSSVRKATSMQLPALELITKKRGSSSKETRLVPVQQSVLNQILEFIEKNRAPVMRRTGKSRNDHDTVLVSETTGKPLVANTITSELHMLRKAARITGRAHPHMFRHTFITRLFKALTEQYKLRNPNDLRNYLLDGEKLKREVAEWTGHSNVNSLENYIHLAFEGTKEYAAAIDVVALSGVIDITLRSIDEAHRDLKNVSSKNSILEILNSLSARLQSISRDLDALR